MPMGRPKAELVLSEDEIAQLSSIARSRSVSAALSLRARIVLAAAEGQANSEIAARFQISDTTAGKWLAGTYALFAGLVFIVMAGAMLAPVIHSVLHHFHLETGGR